MSPITAATTAWSSDDSDQGALSEHAYYCFDVIDSKLNSTPLAPPRFDGNLQYPLFVTWNIKSRSSDATRLRGCIGNFEPMSIGEGLREYAAISAFEDRRFDPITAKEVPRLECGVSLLTDFELCDNYLDWTIGTHGIYIQLPNPVVFKPKPYIPSSPLTSTPSSTPTSSASSLSLDSRSSSCTTASSVPSSTTSSTKAISRRPTYLSISQLPPMELEKAPRTSSRSILSATYLPDVAAEQGWTQLEAIDSVIRKSGYSGRITQEIRNSLRLARYQSKKVHVTWEEWKAARG
ncbi:BQ2448_4621 [Microbotryum intermedium]|uniref:BQ2448_4621 protein n=1 Tax=Microbotryum intermedium TaxID=269621 RepID=A0A238FFB7_9BASI|nr:BQ2448_4621 [Microbotryum intermedium]